MGCLCSKDIEQRKPRIKVEEKPKKEQNLPKIDEIIQSLPKPPIDDLVRLEEFQKKINIQDDFFIKKDDENDFEYTELKKYERNKLEEIFKNEYETFELKELSKLKLECINNTEINYIKNNEDSKNRFKIKIANNIETIISNNNLYKIEYLTILLVGRKNVGKTTLIKYILDSEDLQTIEQDKYTIYRSDKVPYLQLIEFQGIGYNKEVSPEEIGNETCKLISDLIEGIKTDNYNNFIHCIWYCITNTIFEKSELDVLKKLKNSYKSEDIMPIIMVYTQTEDDDIADNMFKVIRKEQGEISCVKTIAKNIKIDENEYIETKGKEELLKETMDKCTKALKGKMINLMINKISKDLENDLKKNNEQNKNDILQEIINEFIGGFNEVLNDGDFINYIIKIFIFKLKKFYGDEIPFSNKSQNLLINSILIKDIKNFINENKNKINTNITKIAKEVSKDFINIQAKKEKNCEMKIINKRRLKDFRNTSKIFLRNNFYYKLEQYIIKYLIINICPSYLSEFRKNIDKIVINLLKIDNNEDIKKHLEYCFLIKLKNFADERNIIMEQPKFDFKENYNSSSDIKNKIKDEILIKNEEEKTDDISDKESGCGDKKNINKSKIEEEEEEQWFIFNNSENINNEILSKFLNFVNTQESDFNKKTNDIPLNKLNQYIQNDLMNFFDTNKKDFIKNKIDNIYIKKNFNFEINIIKDILKEEKFKSIYHNKFNEEFELLIQNNNITKIDYLTIIIVGKSGVGKSTLINNMLKLEGEKKAQTDVGFPVTKATTIFKNEKIPFLNLIDTPGIEHS